VIGMPGQKRARTRELLERRLELVLRWYEGMVDPSSSRFYYLYLPDVDELVHKNSPIRDLGSVWDAEVLGDFLDSAKLEPVIQRSLRHYADYLVERDDYSILDPRRLGEPSSIAHSAFMILAELHARSAEAARVAALATGILRQQRPDGSYRVHFEDLPDHGEELYAGEAMLALMETYDRFPDERYLESVEQGFRYYDAEYFSRGRVSEDMLVFFANWQSQACRRLFEATRSAAVKQGIADYLHRMHDRIAEQGFYDSVERHPRGCVSVEVACALEGLNDAYAVARAASERHTEHYRRCICAGLDYLLELQCTRNGTERERGGFGMSLGDRAQRIDVTGHAASALMKSVENGIECGERSEEER
jgi:hypothetical protein